MSTIVTDTITGKSTATTVTIGSPPVVSSSANSMTIRGEGSNQTSIQQGLAKAFLSYKATDTVSIYNSNNITSVTDHGTGDQSPNYTNNFSSGTDYACSAFGQEDSGGGGRIMCGKGTPGTGDRRVNTVNTSNVVKDLLYFNIVYHGDLT